MHGNGLLHNAERRHESKSSPVSKRCETSAFVVEMKPRAVVGEGWRNRRTGGGVAAAAAAATPCTCTKHGNDTQDFYGA